MWFAAGGKMRLEGLEIATLVTACRHGSGRRQYVAANPRAGDMLAEALESVVVISGRHLAKLIANSPKEFFDQGSILKTHEPSHLLAFDRTVAAGRSVVTGTINGQEPVTASRLIGRGRDASTLRYGRARDEERV